MENSLWDRSVVRETTELLKGIPVTPHADREEDGRVANANANANATPRPLYSQVGAPVRIVEEDWWAPGSAWTGKEKRKSPTPTGVRTRKNPARSECRYTVYAISALL
jgi:hypothetical protein